nr:GGDEF domain-containing protein [Alkalibacter mobilis]
MLNNELINARRQLEKANSKLYVLNEELNNRLVKDTLTGLVSRYQYTSEMKWAIGKFPGKVGVYTFIDIDDFKSVNDTYGHAAGDAYLIEFARRLKDLKLKNTIKIRVSGDEFGIFTYGLEYSDETVAEEIWNALHEALMSEPIIINDVQMPLAVSAGMSTYGVDTDNIFELVDYADYAMYTAKRRGKNNYAVFDMKKYLESKS